MTTPVWAGCDAAAWARLLARNRFAVHRSRYRVAAVITAASALNTLLGAVQRIVHGPRVARTPVRHAPVFVLGHWRTGTTLLHELLAADPRHAAPTTYDCFTPHHHLLTRSWLPHLLRRFVSDRRPMDRMAVGWDRPQEDEFALALLGQPSPYEWIAFPNRPGAADADSRSESATRVARSLRERALDLRDLPRWAVRRWERTLYRFVQAITYRNGGRRVILKSPPHTCRVPTLLRLFPEARFVHIVRDPYSVYPSTLHLWRVLAGVHGLQPPDWASLPEFVLDTFTTFHARLEESRPLVPKGRLYDLRYEDLVRDPVGELAKVYRALDLGEFEPARAGVESYLARVRGYEPGRYLLTDEERDVVRSRWGEVIGRYGY
jgi:omega-hydroxy-beta-dihydromenaquinone-9 sulfotransferase